MSTVVEVVNLKVKPEYDQDDFLKTNESMTRFLKEQKGVISRSLCLNEETQTWVDIVYWKDMTLALAAQNEFSKSALCIDFATQIEKQSVTIQHVKVLSSIG